MRRLVALAAALATAFAAPAAVAQIVPGWAHEAAAGVQFAYYAQGGAELAVRCKGSSVEVVLYIDSALLAQPLQTRTSAIFAVVIDGADRVQWIETKLVIERSVTSIGVGGQVAEQLVHAIGGASQSVAVSLFATPPGPDAVEYNRTQFPIFGALDAIKTAYAGCGISY